MILFTGKTFQFGTQPEPILQEKRLRNFTYSDETVIHNARMYYLRTKFGRRGSVCVMTIRTHRNGKGQNLAQVKGVIKEDLDQLRIVHKLARKFKFQFLQIVDIPAMPE